MMAKSLSNSINTVLYASNDALKDIHSLDMLSLLSVEMFLVFEHHAMIDPEVTSLHTAFVIIYLQELAWISAPLLISANVFLHACLRKLEIGILIFSGSIFAFFLVSGIFISLSLYFVHSRALGRKQVRYLTPYIVAKIFRMLVLGTFSVVILFSPKLIRTYFYASIYGVFECVAGAIALENKQSVVQEPRAKTKKKRESDDARLA